MAGLEHANEDDDRIFADSLSGCISQGFILLPPDEFLDRTRYFLA